MPAHKKRQSPKAGVVSEKRYKGTTYKLTVVADSEGVRYKVGKQLFKTPTAAARSITGTNVNGWTFWQLD